MEDKGIILKEHNSAELTEFDYENSNLPRDFDIRIEVAEQREVLEDQ
jgi:hypothetical protein